MQPGSNTNFSRRRFLKLTGITALGAPLSAIADYKAEAISIVTDSHDAIARNPPCQWAVKELEAALTSKGLAVRRFEQLQQATGNDLCILVAGTSSAIAKKVLKETGISVPEVPEALGLVRLVSEGRPLLLATANDGRGIVYAVLELADKVNHSAQPLTALNNQVPVTERPANEVRSLTRLFTSDLEDKPWYNDKEMWPQYLTMLATQRFNRFNLALGIGYDFLRNVKDAYFLFAYPFLLPVPGHDVKAVGLPDTERDSNLKMLQFISEQTVARGMEFQLGLWMHGYEWLNSPNPNYTISGLTAENHGPYCRDAVRALLQSCPAISGITFRIHGESGVTEGSYQFWQTIFDGVKTCGREVRIDMHAKGMDQGMVDSALATGLPVTISPKYWAEFMGMPYHQADIRALEVPEEGKKATGLMNLSTGSRIFTRYGYGDLLKEDRTYKVLHRIWPGTQRVLLWGDPVTAAAHSRAFSFSGSAGVELMEPLSFKGRRGTGIAGTRAGYSDSSLDPKWDWQKYLYTLRVFGRLMYNPDSDADVWRRQLLLQFGTAADAMESALANATRILPIVLTVHATSAGNNTYWPEMYANQPIVNATGNNIPGDTPSPKIFGNVSPLDPQLFSRINDYAAGLLKGELSGRYTPVEYAHWITGYASEAVKFLKQSSLKINDSSKPEFRRMHIDVSMQAGLGFFFAAKFRAAVLYEIFMQSGSKIALDEALIAYRAARSHWANVAAISKDVYRTDITVGERPFLRGHWLDRLPAIDADIADMERKQAQVKADGAFSEKIVRAAISTVLSAPHRVVPAASHTPVQMRKAQPVEIKISFDKEPSSVQLCYRHVNHAERFKEAEMQLRGRNYTAGIPVEYTNSPYPLQYYFVIRNGPASVLYPGFDANLANQPYFVVHHV